MHIKEQSKTKTNKGNKKSFKSHCVILNATVSKFVSVTLWYMNLLLIFEKL